jgi:hypothetical protein
MIPPLPKPLRHPSLTRSGSRCFRVGGDTTEIRAGVRWIPVGLAHTRKLVGEQHRGGWNSLGLPSDL